MATPLEPGLYIVATPIGNLGDVSQRARETLGSVSAVACEDTRVTGKLLQLLGLKQRLIRYDDHASEATRDHLLQIATTAPIALVSDAGTPLISDPGYRLVREARARGVAVTSIPGPSAATVALTLSGLPSDRFLFAGFLPNKDKARGDVLGELAALRATLVFYETAPRLGDSLAAIGRHLPGREVSVARELTKRLVGGKQADIDMPITDLKPVPFHALWRTGVAAESITKKSEFRSGLDSILEVGAAAATTSPSDGVRVPTGVLSTPLPTPAAARRRRSATDSRPALLRKNSRTGLMAAFRQSSLRSLPL